MIPYKYKMFCGYSLLNLQSLSTCPHHHTLLYQINDFCFCFVIYLFYVGPSIYKNCIVRVLVYAQIKACYTFLIYIRSPKVMDRIPLYLSSSLLKCCCGDPMQASTTVLSSWLQSVFLTQEITIMILFSNFMHLKFFQPSSSMFPES